MKTLVGMILALTVAAVIATSLQEEPASAPTPVANETSANNKTPLIVHEWGTFTTFSGSNGVHMDFRPLLDQDLPYFVMDRANQSGFIWLGKSRIRSRVRMETPVTYFYTDVERSVKAKVRFPKGMLTEFYPPVREMAPAYDATAAQQGDGEPIGNGMLDWGTIQLIPTSALRPNVSDGKTSNFLQETIAREILLPADGNHYGHARETDSALVYTRWPGFELPEWIVVPEKSPSGAVKLAPGHYLEKFLFYRGVGQFDVPVDVKTDESGQVTIKNKGQQSLSGLILLTVKDDQLMMTRVSDCAPNSSSASHLPAESVSFETLRGFMIEKLTAAGLYEKEAVAMVNTWQNSWFTEQGTRLFYLVPQETTDELLPLEISPKPDQTVRVMVGRVEIMSATLEQQLMTALKRSVQEREAAMAKAVEEQTAVPVLTLPSEFAAMGRMAEPALARLQAIATERKISEEAEAFLQQITTDIGQ